MAEIRKDYILNRYVIIATDRGKRPHDFAKDDLQKPPEHDIFGIGNEGETPPEIDRIPPNGDWKVRVFPNKFGIVGKRDEESKIDLRTDNKFFTFADAIGEHEVLVENPDINTMFSDLSTDEIKDVLEMYKKRIDAIYNENSFVKYVLIFKNHKKPAGTSIYHSHTQIIGMNIFPPIIQEEEDACKKYDSCPYCDIIQVEKDSDRRIWEDDHIIAFAPYASRFNLETWIFSKRHLKKLNELDETEMNSLASCMKYLTGRLAEIDAPYNFEIHEAADKSHFHIELTPRLSTWAGFEIGSDIIINAMSPENAAKFYRKEEWLFNIW